MSYKDKFINSLNKLCEENLQLLLNFNMTSEIEDLLFSEEDKFNFNV